MTQDEMSNFDIKFITRLQALIKRFLAKIIYFDLQAQRADLLPSVENNQTLYGEPLHNIPLKNIYILRDNSGNRLYAFDINEIWEWVCNLENNTNPYTNNTITPFIQRQINRLYENRVNSEPPLELDLPYSARLTNIFLQIESMGCYANMEGFRSMSDDQVENLFQVIYQECPLIKKVLNETDMAYLSDHDYNQESVLYIMEKIFNPNDPKEELEVRSLCFTLQLSKFLYPNNDELENFYSNDLSQLIQQIINENTYTEYSSSYEDDSSYDDDLSD